MDSSTFCGEREYSNTVTIRANPRAADGLVSGWGGGGGSGGIAAGPEPPPPPQAENKITTRGRNILFIGPPDYETYLMSVGHLKRAAWCVNVHCSTPKSIHWANISVMLLDTITYWGTGSQLNP